MIEEKYGSFNLFIMMLVVAIVTGSVNSIFNKNKAILGASGICFMLIVLSSFVNITNGKIPLTFVLICIFYIVNEIFSGLAKKDHISHSSHLLGALCGAIFGLFIF